MSAPDESESGLPYTPSETGRRSRVGYLGFHGVDFADLWPLLAGLVGSLALGFWFFLGEGWPGSSWEARSVLACLPAGAGFGYLHGFVVGRPPHFKGDLWIAVLNARVAFGEPPFARLPLLPRVGSALGSGGGPWRPSRALHPRLVLESGRGGGGS